MNTIIRKLESIEASRAETLPRAAAETAIAGAVLLLADHSLTAARALANGGLEQGCATVAAELGWQAHEILGAACQIAAYRTACELLLPALANWASAADRPAAGQFAAQVVRNSLGHLRELPLLSQGKQAADSVLWRLASDHQLRMSVAADRGVVGVTLAEFAGAVTVAAACTQRTQPEHSQLTQQIHVIMGQTIQAPECTADMAVAMVMAVYKLAGQLTQLEAP